MRFSSWYPAEQIAADAPDGPGVFQVRAATLLQYPRGKSAMVHYGQAAQLRSSMRAWASQQGRAGYLYRHTLDVGGRTLEAALERVLTRFEGRFGAKPTPESQE